MVRLALFPLLLLSQFADACFDADIENFMRQKEGANWKNTSRRYYPGIHPKSYRELFSNAAEFLFLSSNYLGVEVNFACVSIKIDYDESNPQMAREESYAWPKYNEDGRLLHSRRASKEFTRNFTQNVSNELNIARAEWMDRVIVYVRRPNQEKEHDYVFFDIIMKSSPRYPADPNLLQKDIRAVANRAYKAALDVQRRSTSTTEPSTSTTTEPSTTTFFSNLPPPTTTHPRTMSTSHIIFTKANVSISVVLILSIVLIGLLVKSLIYNKKNSTVVEMTNFAFLKNGDV